MPRDDQLLLRHMLDAAQKATSFVEGRSRNDLDSDEKLELAVIRLVEVIGEAAKNLSQEFKDKNPQIPWKQIMGTRDRLIHGYFDVDPDLSGPLLRVICLI